MTDITRLSDLALKRFIRKKRELVAAKLVKCQPRQAGRHRLDLGAAVLELMRRNAKDRAA